MCHWYRNSVLPGFAAHCSVRTGLATVATAGPAVIFQTVTPTVTLKALIVLIKQSQE